MFEKKKEKRACETNIKRTAINTYEMCTHLCIFYLHVTLPSF